MAKKEKTEQEQRAEATSKSNALPKVLKSFVDIEEKIEKKAKYYRLLTKDNAREVTRGWLLGGDFKELISEILEKDRNLISGNPKIAKKGFVKQVINRLLTK